jgi:predicted DCC family thiol-disulfide oxidoreductase YuxK
VADRPLVVFDGDCAFCRFWVERWQQQARGLVDFEPRQSPDVARRLPAPAHERAASALQLIEADGRVSEAAAAVFRLRALRGRRGLLWAYEHVAGARAVTERAYRFIADHRSLAAVVTRLLWGRFAAPSTYARATWLFLRLLGLVYLIAFWSLGEQVLGLVGHDGILPADAFLAEARETYGNSRFWRLPTLAWVSASDRALQASCIGGAALASLLVIGVLPALVLPLLWLLYLSLSVVCRGFLAYQWDALLIETGFLAIFIAPLVRFDSRRRIVDPPRVAVWLMWWLLFRLMAGAGVIKLTSGDPTWRTLTALAFHFETQPIPTPVAWYAHQLPLSLLKASTFAVLAVEITVPFLILAPRRLRAFAFVPLVGLQLCIALTGNYAFFNLLTAAVCLFLLDDASLGSWGRLRSEPGASRWRRWLIAAVAVVTVPVSMDAFASRLRIELPAIAVVDRVADVLRPFRSANAYGLFATMTTARPEITIEGSEDGAAWTEYQFKYKPGNTARRPPWVAPHQPRLDWEMWFAAFSVFEDEPWLQNLHSRLLERKAHVLELFERDPFEGRTPRYVRSTLYQYRFTTVEEGRSGAWWRRDFWASYSPPQSASTVPR